MTALDRHLWLVAQSVRWISAAIFVVGLIILGCILIDWIGHRGWGYPWFSLPATLAIIAAALPFCSVAPAQAVTFKLRHTNPHSSGVLCQAATAGQSKLWYVVPLPERWHSACWTHLRNANGVLALVQMMTDDAGSFIRRQRGKPRPDPARAGLVVCDPALRGGDRPGTGGPCAIESLLGHDGLAAFLQGRGTHQQFAVSGKASAQLDSDRVPVAIEGDAPAAPCQGWPQINIRRGHPPALNPRKAPPRIAPSGASRQSQRDHPRDHVSAV